MQVPGVCKFAMANLPTPIKARPLTNFLGRLRRDQAGNTMAIVAAGIVPLLAMVGGGIDMSRSYLSQSRLQSACDAGVLAARKQLATRIVPAGSMPADVKTSGDSFFNINFRAGSYGTANRAFAMTINADMSVSGTASVDVPTTLMQLFAYNKVPLNVDCSAKLNFSNTDVMMVLDTTGSMLETNPSDAAPRIDMLRTTVKAFYNQVEAAKTAGTRIRYGFLPYATNVNVGTLLKSDWVVDNWNYHGRKSQSSGKFQTYDTYDTTYTDVTGTATGITAYLAATCPSSTVTYVYGPTTTDPDGTTHGSVTVNGDYFWCNLSSDGAQKTVNGTKYVNYSYTWTTKKTGTVTNELYEWQYKLMPFDVTFTKGATGADPLKTGFIPVQMYGYPSPAPANLEAWFRGCIEERDTYEIKDYNNVDFSKALDLDIDLVPTGGNDSQRWRPMLHEISFEPEIWGDGTGTFQKSPAPSAYDYLMAGWSGFSACPAPARKLDAISSTDLDTYLTSLTAAGSTYHDIGMIWGGRLMSPTGLFAAENADLSSGPTNRNLIFLTDGLTAPLDLSYGAYGIEPIDQRRCSKCDNAELTSIVEKRFTVACDEVKKRNINVWVIGFGTTLNPVLTNCAGPGHAFEAKDAATLTDVFSKIAAAMGDLRVAK